MNVKGVIQRYNTRMLMLFVLFFTWHYWNNHLQVLTNNLQTVNSQGMSIDFMIIVYLKIDKIQIYKVYHSLEYFSEIG